MKIKDFINEYNGANDDNEKRAVIEKHVTSHYISYADKVAISEGIVKATCYSDNNFKRNSPMLVFLSITKAIEKYTDLRFSPDSSISEFDDLEKIGLCSVILDAIGEDYQAFKTVLDLTVNDIQSYEYSLIGIMNSTSDGIIKFINSDDFRKALQGEGNE